MHQTDPVYKIQVDFVAATKNNNSMDMYSGYSGSGGKKHKMLTIKHLKNQFLFKYSTFLCACSTQISCFFKHKKYIKVGIINFCSYIMPQSLFLSILWEDGV